MASSSKTVNIDLYSTLQTDANMLNIQTVGHEFVSNKQTFFKKMLSNQREYFTPVFTNESSVPVMKDHCLTIVDKDLLWNETKIATLGDVSMSNITQIQEAFSLSGYFTDAIHYTKVVNTANEYTFFVDDQEIEFPAGQIITGSAHKTTLLAIYAADSTYQKMVVYDAVTQEFRTAYSDISNSTKNAFGTYITDPVYNSTIQHTKALQINLNDDVFFSVGTNFFVIGKRYNYTNSFTLFTYGDVAATESVHCMLLKFTEDQTDQADNVYCPWGKLMADWNPDEVYFYDYCPEFVKSIDNLPQIYCGMIFRDDQLLLNTLPWTPDFDVTPIQNLVYSVGFNIVTLSGCTVGLNMVAEPDVDADKGVNFPTNVKLRTDLLVSTNVCDLLHIGEEDNSIQWDNLRPINNYSYQAISSDELGNKLYHGMFSGLTYTDAKVEPETQKSITYDSEWLISSYQSNFKIADWGPDKPLYLLTYGDNAYNVLCYKGCMLCTPGLFDPEMYPTIIDTDTGKTILYSDESNSNWWEQTISEDYNISRVTLDMYKINDSNGTVVSIRSDQPVVETNNQQSPFFWIRDMEDPDTSFGPATFTPSLIYVNAGINIAMIGEDRCISFNDGSHVYPIYNPRCNSDGTMSKALSQAVVNTVSKNGASYITPFMLYNIPDRNISTDLFVTVTNGLTFDLSTTPMYLRSFSQEGINITSFYKSRLSATPLVPALDANGNPIIYSQLPPGSDYYNNGTIETLGQFGDQRYVMRTVDNLAMMFTTEYSKVFANGIYFTLYGQSYLYDGNNIMVVDVDPDGLVTLGEIVSYCANLLFLGTNNIKAYFYRDYDQSIYSFSGGRDLIKEKEWSGASKPERVLWDSSANTLYWVSHDITYAYHNQIISQVGIFDNLWMTLDGLATIHPDLSGIGLPNRVVDGDIIIPFDLTTGLIGISMTALQKYTRSDVRIFDSQKRNSQITITSTVVGTDTNKDRVSNYVITPNDYDRFGYCFLKHVPMNAEGVGLQLNIRSPNEISIDAIVVEMQDTGQKIETKSVLSR